MLPFDSAKLLTFPILSNLCTLLNFFAFMIDVILQCERRLNIPYTAAGLRANRNPAKKRGRPELLNR
jgi:hypothetical protein